MPPLPTRRPSNPGFRSYGNQEFFTYNAVFSSLAAAATSNTSINIQADSMFEVQKLTFVVDLAGAAQTDSSRVLPLVRVLITDTGSGRQFSDVAVPLTSLFGTGSLPFILPAPRVFMPSTSVTVQVTNYSAATTYANLILSFIGRKIYS